MSSLLDPLSAALILACNTHQQSAERLLGEVPEDQWTRQPSGLPNHAAWTLAHLCHYHPAILSLIRGESVADPGLHPDAGRFDAGSTPVDDPHLYPSPPLLLQTYLEGHRRIREALQQSDPGDLLRPPGLSRWQKAFPQSGQTLMYLLAVHEGYHLGEVMSWRRALGLPAVDG